MARITRELAEALMQVAPSSERDYRLDRVEYVRGTTYYEPVTVPYHNHNSCDRRRLHCNH